MKRRTIILALVASLCLISMVKARPYEACGYLEAGVELDCVMFNSDHSGRHELLGDTAG